MTTTTTPLHNRMDAIGWDQTPRGCWEWRGAQFAHGYGAIWVGNGRTDRVHRVSYERWVAPIPTGLFVRHTCDNPPCLNPEHLTVGTAADNYRDAVERGRNTRGLIHGMRKLTPETVQRIRERYAAGGTSHRELARDYGISSTQVGNIVRRRHWKEA